MGITSKGLAKAFGKLKRPDLRKNKSKVVTPKGRAPHIDWAYIADVFLSKFYDRCPDGKPYGHWVTPEMWTHLFPYGTRGQGYFHPSSGLAEGLSCDRSVMLDLMCAERDAEGGYGSKMAKILDNGTNRHIGLHILFLGMAHYNWMGIAKSEPEVRVKHPILPVEGTLDARVTMDSGHVYIIDFKTINDKGFASRYEPSEKHTAQLNTYLGCAGADTGYIIYENKNNQSWATPMGNMRVEYNPTWFADSRMYMIGVLTQLAKKELPEFNEKVCIANKRFCSYIGVCGEHQAGTTFEDLDYRTAPMKKRHLKVIR